MGSRPALRCLCAAMMQWNPDAGTRMRYVLLFLMALVFAADAFAPPTGPGLRPVGHGQRFRRPSSRSTLRTQEQPPKKTTGFENLFSGVARQFSLETQVDPETGQTKPKYTSLQLIVLSAIQPIGLYYLFTLYKGAGLPPFDR